MWNQKSQAGIKFGKMLQFIAETAVISAMEEVTKDKNVEILKRLRKKINIQSFTKKKKNKEILWNCFKQKYSQNLIQGIIEWTRLFCYL